MKKNSTIRIGISGWTYAPWRGVLYPEDLPHKRELEYASRMLNSIEINGSFYSLQRPSSYQKWYEQTPEGFVFSVKGPRFITHMRRLKEIEQPLANFLASGVLGLKEKLGPILWQFPPNFKFDAERFEAFFKQLPRDTAGAEEIAKGHDAWLKGRVMTKAEAKHPLHHVVEIRNESFANADFIALLRRHNVGLVFADTAGHWPFAEDVTSDIVYLRLHGAEELYASGYDDKALDRWAQRISAWHAGREPKDAKHWSEKPAKKRESRSVFVYFDNDVKVRAPFDAMRLADRLGPEARSPERTADAPQFPNGKHTAAVPRTNWPGFGRPGATRQRPLRKLRKRQKQN